MPSGALETAQVLILIIQPLKHLLHNARREEVQLPLLIHWEILFCILPKRLGALSLKELEFLMLKIKFYKTEIQLLGLVGIEKM